MSRIETHHQGVANRNTPFWVSLIETPHQAVANKNTPGMTVWTNWSKKEVLEQDSNPFSHYDSNERQRILKHSWSVIMIFCKLPRDQAQIYPVGYRLQNLPYFCNDSKKRSPRTRWRVTTLRGIDFLQTSETGPVRKFTWLDVMSKIYPYFSDDSSSKWDLYLHKIDLKILILKYNLDEIRHRNLPYFSRDSSSSTNDGHHRDPRSRL